MQETKITFYRDRKRGKVRRYYETTKPNFLDDDRKFGSRNSYGRYLRGK